MSGRRGKKTDGLDHLLERCELRQDGGCPELGPKGCTWCGHNWREAWLRRKRGLVRDEEGRWHYVPTKRTKTLPFEAAGKETG